jgi:ribosomal protein L37AE/L43A
MMAGIKNKSNIPESCPKCGEGAFWRESDTGEWKCYYCDPPPVVRRQKEKRKD